MEALRAWLVLLRWSFESAGTFSAPILGSSCVRPEFCGRVLDGSFRAQAKLTFVLGGYSVPRCAQGQVLLRTPR